MDIESVRYILEQASVVALGVGLALGFVLTFNPVVVVHPRLVRLR